jgi:signal transduction histidine kinase
MALARPFRPPMFVIAAALLGLIAVLAALQYSWLGRISDAERARLTATLNDRARAFGEDVDREVTRAYLLFQLDQLRPEASASEYATRYERWLATARFPRLIREIYVVSPGRAAEAHPLERFDPAKRALEPADWPASLAPLRAEVAPLRAEVSRPLEPPPPSLHPGSTSFVYRALVPAAWPDIPALVIPTPIAVGDMPLPFAPGYTVLLLDRGYITTEMLPALVRQHFRGGDHAVDYRLAVVSTSGSGAAVYRSTPDFAPGPQTACDARADLFQVRTQEFAAVAAEVSRFVTFTAGERAESIVRETMKPSPGKAGNGRFSIIVQSTSGRLGGELLARLSSDARPDRWRLLVQHPAGSLERAVNMARRRNLAISTGTLGVLGLSVALLIVSTRRAQDLARRQLEFVATVSHELRTPLAVIRSAADNLADGVIHDDERVRQYGDLLRREGVRLTDLVEQILEFAGLQSGQRALARRPVHVAELLRDVASAAQETSGHCVTIDVAIADRLPAIPGDEAALRRVFQNLIGNAIKYGAAAGWVGVRAAQGASGVDVTISDRGIGIPAADHERIFDPFYRASDVVSAQIQGAGLGLSLVKRIVEAHGGRVTVESAPGQGSAFTVSLPVSV